MFDRGVPMSVAWSNMPLRDRGVERMFDLRIGEGDEQMMMIENDWIQYDATPVRRVAVRGGATCSARFPAANDRAGGAATARWSVDPLTPGRSMVPAGRTPPKRRLRLTARGRLVLLVLPALSVLSAALVTTTARDAEAAPAPGPAVTVTVGADDTLWSVAERVAPTRDPRDVVLELQRANGLRDAVVQPGERLVVPAYQPAG